MHPLSKQQMWACTIHFKFQIVYMITYQTEYICYTVTISEQASFKIIFRSVCLSV